MAKNREPEKLVESETEPSEEEAEGEAEASSEEFDSEPELTQKLSSSAPATKSLPQSAEEEDESESESDSDGPHQKAPPVATNTVHGVLKSSAGAISPLSRPVADPATPSQASNLETSVKKSCIQRIWSEEDEIVLLNGMIGYSTKTRDPFADCSAFYEYIKKDLDFVDVTKTQLQAKMRRLRQKYNNNKSKGKEGKERILQNPHELNAYQLSNTLWGNEIVKENGRIGSLKATGSSRGKRANSVENKDTNKVMSLESVLPAKRGKFFGKKGEYIILEGIEAEEWKKLKKEEHAARKRHLDVKFRQMKFFMDNSKPASPSKVK